MKLDKRRTSQNVEDRRTTGGAKKTLGITGVIIVALLTWIMGGNPLDAIMQNAGGLLVQEQQVQGRELSQEEKQLGIFASQILAGTEDVWTKLFAQEGLTYSPPKMVLFSGTTQSACGKASEQTGPFYCSADESIYLDLNFFNEMKRRFGASGDFVIAYVIAHEVGHHIQYLRGILDKVHQARRQLSQADYNKISVRLELQADYYAGLWAHHDHKTFQSMEIGDLEEGLNAARAIGDDNIQIKTQGYVEPESFNHGTAQQRSAWLKKGYQYGTIKDGDAFSLPDPI